ncbi:hypothetical protein GCM10007989_11590 [Devosia pacifica]|uniref:N-acetyltransferase domain-containing protein n=1 Tax=Devosia pacifica TaxID=1335967 RepID=A0A918RZA4_9HYPH|nr:GNAT family N-acetyltransferase [Devosia pacifica]GHA18027.1 hypothetical protein GCM10007989_11590 [Devosia pacifica]
MSNARIRRLAPSDLPALRGLLQVYAEAFEEEALYAEAPPEDSYLETVLGTPGVIVLVAEVGDEVVGGITAYVLAKLERARSEIYLYDLAVAEPWRRKGIATRLILDLKPIAHQYGAEVIFVQADREDAPAVALYQRLGSPEEPFHFDIQVAPQRGG